MNRMLRQRLFLMACITIMLAVPLRAASREKTVIDEVPVIVIDEYGYPVDADVERAEVAEEERVLPDEEGVIAVRMRPKAIRERTEEPKRKEVTDGGLVEEVLFDETAACRAQLFSPASEVTYQLIVPHEARMGAAICEILSTVMQEEIPILFVGERRVDATLRDVDLTLTKIKVVSSLPQ